MKSVKPLKNRFTLIGKPRLPLKNLGSVMMLYIVSCEDYPDGLETYMVVKITF